MLPPRNIPPKKNYHLKSRKIFILVAENRGAVAKKWRLARQKQGVANYVLNFLFTLFTCVRFYLPSIIFRKILYKIVPLFA